jgi:membrane associated rhomboid family serine protease/DNA-directed RNA polymerase subunit RPC12/RpoP
MNWLIIVATIAVFWCQRPDFEEWEHRYWAYVNDPSPHKTEPAVPGITGALVLDGWKLKGLVGHMWLHAGWLHLIGNMWFLWVFGNAVCAKLGNLKHVPLYIMLGVSAGAAHLLFDGEEALGASGAINGIIGAYAVLFYQNEITCYLVFWPILPYFYVRQFGVSSIWMILFWLLWDAAGAAFFSGSSNVAYFAHLGGFATGFGFTFLLCMTGWIKMEVYEKSLWQAWQEWRHGRKDPYEEYRGRMAAMMKKQEPKTPAPSVATSPPRPASPKIVPMIDPVTGNVERTPSNGGAIIVACSSCGKSIKVTRQYAGKVVLCPHCKGRVLVPDVRAPRPAGPRKLPPAIPSTGTGDTCIRFRCHCGKAVKVPARLAGRSGKCPQCGSRIQVPYA